MRLTTCFVSLVLLAACSPSTDLAVYLQTDLVPGEELDSVHVSFDGTPAPPRAIGRNDVLTEERPVAEFGGVAPGRHEVRVDLRRRGETVLSRTVVVRVSASATGRHTTFGLTVVMTRSCRGVTCPAEGDPAGATECLAGRCVAPDCTTLGAAGCRETECERDDDCGVQVACAVGRCWDGICVAQSDPALCRAEQYCDPDVGCVDRSAPPVDGGSARPDPVLILSRTFDGPPDTTFGADEAVFGRILHVSADDTEACAEIVGQNDGYCDTLANWTRLPNAEWSYDGASATWRAVFPAFVFPPGTYRFLARRVTDGARSAPVVWTLSPARPVIELSATPDGPPETSFRVSSTVHGRVRNLRAEDTEACVEIVGSSDGYCSILSNWTRLPNGDWSYEASSRMWRATFVSFRFPEGSYRMFSRDASTDLRSEPVVLTLTPAQPEVVFSTTLDGPPVSTFAADATVHGRALHLRADNTEACVEVVGVSDGYCSPFSSWTRLPNSDWSYDASVGRWRATLAPGAFPPGTYRTFFRNTTTGESSAPVLLTLLP